MGGLPKHEINIILGDFNTRLLDKASPMNVTRLGNTFSGTIITDWKL